MYPYVRKYITNIDIKVDTATNTAAIIGWLTGMNGGLGGENY